MATEDITCNKDRLSSDDKISHRREPNLTSLSYKQNCSKVNSTSLKSTFDETSRTIAVKKIEKRDSLLRKFVRQASCSNGYHRVDTFPSSRPEGATENSNLTVVVDIHPFPEWERPGVEKDDYDPILVLENDIAQFKDFRFSNHLASMEDLEPIL